MTIDEKWEKVRSYYESVYKDPKTGIKIKFSQRIPDADIEILFKKMNLLPKDLDNTEDHRLKKFSNVIRLLRQTDLDKLS